MPDTYSSLAVHLVFGTHRHQPLISPQLRLPLHKYIFGIARNQDCLVLAIDGVADHVHVLIELPPKLAVSELVKTLKCNSSSWASDRIRHRFQWQAGYSAFAVGRSIVPRVVRYIEGQVEHHRRVSYREELDRFLRESGLVPDSRFLAGA